MTFNSRDPDAVAGEMDKINRSHTSRAMKVFRKQHLQYALDGAARLPHERSTLVKIISVLTLIPISLFFLVSTVLVYIDVLFTDLVLWGCDSLEQWLQIGHYRPNRGNVEGEENEFGERERVDRGQDPHLSITDLICLAVIASVGQVLWRGLRLSGC
jgi:hypothetical protein